MKAALEEAQLRAAGISKGKMEVQDVATNMDRLKVAELQLLSQVRGFRQCLCQSSAALVIVAPISRCRREFSCCDSAKAKPRKCGCSALFIPAC